ncbi:nitroreductase/quinone reductase family protein [Nocardia sp. NBC_01009]|uniref:nitroreductase/quinone reductase family protein n=1 Tax=Nocardia sp. NBC_01009 TaxID=2975996 RepID=UPI003870E531|nr:nitroreductase/quinone reductase family protein [Nocardia sp. NBC_01009]
MSPTQVAARIGVLALRTNRLCCVPTWLYRAHLGFVFGTRLLRLEYTGRRNKGRKSVVLVVVDRPAPGEFVVASWSGRKGRWYGDVQADPHVRITTGVGRNVAAVATSLSDSESGGVVGRYIYADPDGWQQLRSTIEDTTGHTVQRLVMVKFRIHQDS